MQGVNLAIIMGNLTRDPELRYTPNGQPVTSFGVATNRSWKDANGEKKDEVEFHEIVAWGKQAELCSQYLTKGGGVHILGRLQTRSWEGQDGAKRQKTEIVAREVTFVGSRRDSGDYSADAPAKAADAPAKEGAKTKAKKDKSEKAASNVTPEEEEINIDDIPF